MKGVETFDFDNVKAGYYRELETRIGIYSATGKGFAVLTPTGANAAWGGASPSGEPQAKQTQYAAIGAQSSQTLLQLQLEGKQNYFGMYWSAGDAANQLTFYLGQTIVAAYSTRDVVAFVSGLAGYYGNPNNGANRGEPYAYLNFYATEGDVFDRIVFTNAGTGSGFEMDNHSVLLRDEAGEDGDGGLSGTVVPQSPTSTTPVPEPASWTLATLAIVGVGLWTRSSRRAPSRTSAQ